MYKQLKINKDEHAKKIKKIIQVTFVMESGAMGLVLGVCLMLPCLVPLVLQPIRTIIEAKKQPPM
jgi:hypothetical protein